MTDQTNPAATNHDRRLAHSWAETVKTNPECWGRRQLAAARVILEAVPAPTRPTLADMTEEERLACEWMQADVAGHITRYVILDPSDEDGEAALIDPDGRLAWTLPDYVTPRPDLPRMEWPGTENPAPALPDGWRLADHPEHGRVIVANAIPGRDGHIHYVFSSDRYPTGLDWHHCTPAELTYLDTDQEEDQ